MVHVFVAKDCYLQVKSHVLSLTPKSNLTSRSHVCTYHVHYKVCMRDTSNKPIRKLSSFVENDRLWVACGSENVV